MSVQKLAKDNNCTVSFNGSHVFVKDNRSGKVLLKASNQDNVYPITLTSQPRRPVALLSLFASGPTWHRRLGHCVDRVLGALKQNKAIFFFIMFLVP